MSKELLTCYKMNDANTPICLSRDEYYQNRSTTYDDHLPCVVDLLLFNEYGELLMQKRSKKKRSSPGRLHSSVGGHVNWGETPDFSMTHESVEEIGVAPVIVAAEQYKQAWEKLYPYTDRFPLIKLYKEWMRDDRRHETDRLKDRMWLYFGVYRGPVICPDRSGIGFEYANLDDLIQDIAEHPLNYTTGLNFFIADFEEDMRAFVAEFCPRAQEKIEEIA